MLPINIVKNELVIKVVTDVELDPICNIINESKENIRVLGVKHNIDYYYLKDRYVESLANSMEYFCSIYYKQNLIGFLKGRLENREVLESWLMLLLIKNDSRNKGIGTIVLKEIESYFKNNFNVKKFNVILKGTIDTNKFWFKNGYKFMRKVYLNDNEFNSYIFTK